MKKYFKILRIAFSYKAHALLNVSFNLLYVVFNLASLLVFIPFLSLIFKTEVDRVVTAPNWDTMSIDEYFSSFFNYEMAQYVEAHGSAGALAFICMAVGVLFLLKNVTRYFAMFFLAHIRIGVERDLRKSLYDKVVALPIGYYSDERKGDIIARLTNDVQEVQVSIMSTLELIFREPVAIVLYLGVMIYTSWQLTLFSLLLLPLSGLVISRVGKSLKRSSTKGQDRLGQILSNIEETLTGLKVIKAFTAEKAASEKFGRLNESYKSIMTRLYRKRDLASPLSEVMGSMVMIALVWFGGNLVLNGDVDAGLTGEKFIGYIVVFSQLLRPIQGIATAYSNINKGLASVERIDVILEAENTIVDAANPTKVEAFSSKIEYRNISFAYGAEDVLKQVNLTIEKGKTIALVGESGGGKSTIADLLPRFYDVRDGEISIDDVNIKNIALDDLRGLMGIVTQRSILFNDTIFNNIAFGLTGTSKEDVIRAAKIANAHDFIMGTEKGYDTNIGDAGGKLSGGQQQRISIARAVLKNPPILILDEATSALDTESEKLVQDALFKLMENRTSIVIAHRLSTIQHADEIIVLQKGEIAERGTHDELIASTGIYRKLTELQSFA